MSNATASGAAPDWPALKNSVWPQPSSLECSGYDQPIRGAPIPRVELRFVGPSASWTLSPAQEELIETFERIRDEGMQYVAA